MSTIHATVTMPARSGLARDNVVNSFTFDTIDDLSPTLFDEITSQLHDFYELADALVVTPISRYIGNFIDRALPPMVRMYDVTGHLGGTPAGSPIAIRDFPAPLTAAASSTDIPSEVAVCLTMAAAYGADVEFGPGTRPRARDRARVYIGPLNITAVTTFGGICRPDPAFRDNLAEAGVRLARGGALAQLVIWSRVGGTTKTVLNAWVDDATDTQRRRGQRPIVRSARMV